jgi:hypothetical protein
MEMFLRGARWVAPLVAAVWMAGHAAFADIKTFNAAVTAGDYKAAAAAAADTWPTLDKTRPNAPIIAREFAYISMLAGSPEIAQPMARWLVEEGAARENSGVDPIVARVLFQWAAMGDATDPARRQVMLEALAERIAAPDKTDRVSASASAALASLAWRAQAWKDAGAAAGHTIVLAGALGEEGDVSVNEAKLIQIASRFIETPTESDVDAMMQLHRELLKRIPDPPGGAATGAALTRDKAYAWSVAMGTLIDTTRLAKGKRPVFAQLDASTLSPQCEGDCMNLKRVEAGLKPMCLVDWKTPTRPRYPDVALNKRFIGAVYLGLDINADGAIKDIRVLASVPTDVVPEPTVASIRAWSLRVARENPWPDCLIEGTRTLILQYKING